MCSVKGPWKFAHAVRVSSAGDHSAMTPKPSMGAPVQRGNVKDSRTTRSASSNLPRGSP